MVYTIFDIVDATNDILEHIIKPFVLFKRIEYNLSPFIKKKIIIIL